MFWVVLSKNQISPLDGSTVFRDCKMFAQNLTGSLKSFRMSFDGDGGLERKKESLEDHICVTKKKMCFVDMVVYVHGMQEFPPFNSH